MSPTRKQAEPRKSTPGAAGPHRVLVVGRDRRLLLPHVEEAGFELVDTPAEADFVITYGGDGSLLGADRDFPNLPKLAIRNNEEYIKCEDHHDLEVLRKVRRGVHSVRLLPRLRADAKGRTLSGINDVVFHNAHFTAAVRCRVRIDGKSYSDEIVGDGIVVATPFGSSAYYRSITTSVLRVGLGLAFNNSTEAVNHLVLDAKSVIEVEVTRGPGQVMADNSPEQIAVDRGDILTIRMGDDAAEIWEIETLLCKACRFRDSGKPAGFRHV